MAKISSGLCAKCGACAVLCPVFQATGREPLSARGRLHLLARRGQTPATSALAEILSQCLLCGACRAGCPRGLDPPALFIAGREELTKGAGRHTLFRFVTGKALGNPALLAALASLSQPFLKRLPADSGLRLGLSQEKIPPLPDQTEIQENNPPPAAIAYFPGCYATYLQEQISKATTRIVTTVAGALPLMPAGQRCCGLAAENAGDLNAARRLAKLNIEAFSSNDLPILTSCASCYHQLRRYPDLFAADRGWRTKASAFAGRIREFSLFVRQAMQTDPALRPAPFPEPCGVYYHDPCHLRFAAKPISSPARKVLAAIPGLTLKESDNGPQCCGQGGLFHLAWPELSASIRNRLLERIVETRPDLVTTTCSGCLMHIKLGLGPRNQETEVRHLAEILAPLLRHMKKIPPFRSGTVD